MSKKVAESFGGFKKKSYLRGMKERRYIITGKNKLSGEREAITRAMGEQEALARLEAEKKRRKNKRHCAHAWLRVERVLPVELELNFIPE